MILSIDGHHHSISRAWHIVLGEAGFHPDRIDTSAWQVADQAALAYGRIKNKPEAYAALVGNATRPPQTFIADVVMFLMAVERDCRRAKRNEMVRVAL